jgi:hypothetical protein
MNGFLLMFYIYAVGFWIAFIIALVKLYQNKVKANPFFAAMFSWIIVFMVLNDYIKDVKKSMKK